MISEQTLHGVLVALSSIVANDADFLLQQLDQQAAQAYQIDKPYPSGCKQMGDLTPQESNQLRTLQVVPPQLAIQSSNQPHFITEAGCFVPFARISLLHPAWLFFMIRFVQRTSKSAKHILCNHNLQLTISVLKPATPFATSTLVANTLFFSESVIAS